MSKGPEANLWASFKRNLPRGWLAERVENRSGGGNPDVDILCDPWPMKVELKVARKITHGMLSDQAVGAMRADKFLRPGQIAYHLKHSGSGGMVRTLLRAEDTKDLHLMQLVMNPASGRDPFLKHVLTTPLWSEMFDRLREEAAKHWRGFIS